MKRILFTGLVCGALCVPVLCCAQGYPVWQWPSQGQGVPSWRYGNSVQNGQNPQGEAGQNGQAPQGRAGHAGQAQWPGPGMQMMPGRQGGQLPGDRNHRPNDEALRNISERIKADRVNFFTSHIQLTPSEAQQFWPLYNEFDAKKDELYKQRMEIAVRYMSSSTTLTDKELESMLTAYWAVNQKEARLSAEYHKKFLSVLPAAKVMRLYMTEEQFKNFYLQRMRGGRPM